MSEAKKRSLAEVWKLLPTKHKIIRVVVAIAIASFGAFGIYYVVMGSLPFPILSRPSIETTLAPTPTQPPTTQPPAVSPPPTTQLPTTPAPTTPAPTPTPTVAPSPSPSPSPTPSHSPNTWQSPSPMSSPSPSFAFHAPLEALFSESSQLNDALEKTGPAGNSLFSNAIIHAAMFAFITIGTAVFFR